MCVKSVKCKRGINKISNHSLRIGVKVAKRKNTTASKLENSEEEADVDVVGNYEKVFRVRCQHACGLEARGSRILGRHESDAV